MRFLLIVSESSRWTISGFPVFMNRPPTDGRWFDLGLGAKIIEWFTKMSPSERLMKTWILFGCRLIDDFGETERLEKTTKKVEINLVAKILKHQRSKFRVLVRRSL